ncbi:MAG: hypothetical protein FWD35_02590 [Oscillospiraceae bacterium]|nr:hypothetical protein [Oscillospiraceae bacterium]
MANMEDKKLALELGDDDDGFDELGDFDDFDDGDEFESDDEIDAALQELSASGGTVSNPPHYEEEDDDEIAEGIASFYASEGIIGCEDCALGLCDCGYDFE